MMMMMMMKPTFIAHDSINLNAQCAKWGWEWGGGKVMISETEEEETWYKVILRTDGSTLLTRNPSQAAVIKPG